MPISQDRMVSLLREYSALFKSALDLQGQVASLGALVESNDLRAEDAWEILSSHLLIHPIPNPVLLHIETRHFKLFSKRNSRSKMRERMKRSEGKLSLEELLEASHNSAPASLIPRLDGEGEADEYTEWNKGNLK